MSIIKNSNGLIVPVRERREAFGTLGSLNSELVIDTNGDESALVHISSAAFIGTLEFSGAVNSDSTIFVPVVAFPYAIGCAGGTVPSSGQPLLSDALVAANTSRIYAVPVGQLRKLRVRVSAYTSGTCDCSIASDTQTPLNGAIASKPSTLFVTATGAVGVAVTASLPAVSGLRHVLDFISVTRSSTAALASSATPVLITTTNLPGSPVMTLGQDSGGVGIDREVRLDFGSTGLAAVTLGVATTIVCPAYIGVIWRVSAAYRLGV